MTIKELAEHIKSYPPETPCAYGLWLPDDVKGMAEQMGKKVTPDEIEEILYDVHYGHDASEGINWMKIQYAIDEVVKSK